MLKKIISGGQTGADQAGLAAGKVAGLETGGWMPKGFRTDTGPAPDLAILYGVREHQSLSYRPRTILNVKESDATIIFGKPSPGSRLTYQTCAKLGKPYVIIPWPWPKPEEFLAQDALKIRNWIEGKWGPGPFAVLNVAGNREIKNPGIGKFVFAFLLKVLEKSDAL